ncbi:hypothetical protein [Neobacillus sp.]|uniref:hypothetical protein n=1 Tax=Neobacillus sp. TaxID=2675273 RepID=UPI0028A03B1B|nr:hypothetical protein [Neobacillus sp.]
MSHKNLMELRNETTESVEHAVEILKQYLRFPTISAQQTAVPETVEFEGYYLF